MRSVRLAYVSFLGGLLECPVPCKSGGKAPSASTRHSEGRGENEACVDVGHGGSTHGGHDGGYGAARPGGEARTHQGRMRGYLGGHPTRREAHGAAATTAQAV